MGRVGVDLYPEQSGVPLAAVRSFAKSLGGTATNVAVGAARLGRRAAVITKVGDDGFGPYVRDALAGFGVDARFVGTHPTLRTPIVFCELNPPDDPPLLFYRAPTAPDMTVTTDELDIEAIAEVPLFWVTGSLFSAEPARSGAFAALDARGRRRHTVFDLDWRPMFWADPDEATALYRKALAQVTVAVGNQAEVRVAVGTDDPGTAADELLALGVDLAVVKRGRDGVLLASADDRVTVPPIGIDVVCALGAGDAFGAALGHGLLSGWDLERIGRYANAAGAIVASRLACADAMPTTAEIQELLAR